MINPEDKFQTLFNALTDAVFIHDLSGRFSEVNDTACEKLGYERSELLKISLTDIYIAKDVDLIKEKIEELKGRKQISFESIHMAKNGEQIPVDVTMKTIYIENNLVIISIAHDIRKRKKTEEEIQKRANEFEQINKLMVGREIKMIELKKKVKELELIIAKIKQ